MSHSSALQETDMQGNAWRFRFRGCECSVDLHTVFDIRPGLCFMLPLGIDAQADLMCLSSEHMAANVEFSWALTMSVLLQKYNR